MPSNIKSNFVSLASCKKKGFATNTGGGNRDLIQGWGEATLALDLNFKAKSEVVRSWPWIKILTQSMSV